MTEQSGENGVTIMGQDTVKWDAEVDVVIAGGGGAGLSAAIEAADAGAQTLVLEKQPKYWECSTALSGGGVAFAGTDYQKKRGIEDSDELLYKDLREVGQWKNDEKLVRTYVAHQLDTYSWTNRMGVRWVNIGVAAGMSVPRGHRLDPLELVRLLKFAAEKRGVTILFQASVTDLVTRDGAVVGVTAEETTGPARIKARKGVVLACGGFGRDSVRMHTLDPRFDKVLVASGKGNTGDAIRMTQKLGAYLKDMECVKPSFGMHVTGTSAVEIFHAYYLGALIVNKNGKRFVNESKPYKDIGQAALDQPDTIGFQIFDQKVFDRAVSIMQEGEVPLPQESKGLDQAKINLLVKSDSIEELGKQLGLPPGVLESVVEKYNSYAEAGHDLDFGRTTLAGGVGRIQKIDKPPYYSYETKGVIPQTPAGIAVDEYMHVLNAEGKIPGLYAAGEVIGGFHGASYMSGTSVGKSLIFGRIAGCNAATGY